MGTPEFAVPSLESLVERHEVAAVVTATDKPGGRGHQLLQSPVKQAAQRLNIPILQPEKLKNKVFLSQLEGFKAQIFVVVAFRKLPKVVWDMPPCGTINLHASLLPQYRGAAPIQRAILKGEKKSGLTSFRLTHEIDAGDILLQEEMSIGDDETGGELYQRMMNKGGEILSKSLELLESGDFSYISQKGLTSSEAPKIFHEDTRIHWNNKTIDVYNLIRAFSPYPSAWFEHNGVQYKIKKAKVELSTHDSEPGTWNTKQNGTLKIACTDGWLEVLEIQAQGKKSMQTREFLNGLRL